MAALRGDVEVLKLLLAWGANIVARDTVCSIAALFVQQLLQLLSQLIVLILFLLLMFKFNGFKCYIYICIYVCSSATLRLVYRAEKEM